MPTYYKLLNLNGTTPITGFKWPLPKGDKPGEWLPPINGKLVACKNGYHVMKFEDIIEWLGQRLVEVEIKGKPIRTGTKSVVRQARVVRIVREWNARNCRLFAADCAERVLPIFEAKYPGDDRPRKTIQAARAFAKGKISFEKMSAAHRAAHRAAYRAACSAAYRAACSAAYSAERKWQINRLKQYLEGKT